MRIAITGATGNVGTALLRRFTKEPDLDLVGFARRTPLPGSGAPYDSVRWCALDLGAPASVERLREWLTDVDAVIHLAWQIQPSHDRERLRTTNVTGTRHLLNAMRAAGVTTLLYASSVGAYAPGPKDRRVNESWPVTGVPRSDYSVDKATVEALLDNAEREDPRLRVVRLRQALVFQRDAGAQLTRYFLGPLAPVTLLRRRRIPFTPTSRRLRVQAVHADDVAEAYLAALRTEVSGPFNIAADPVLDGPLLASELRTRTVPIPLPVLRALAAGAWWARLQPTEPGWLDLAAAAPLMDCSRAHAELNWRPRRDAREALRELLAGIAEGAGTTSPAMRSDPPLVRRFVNRLPGHGNPA